MPMPSLPFIVVYRVIQDVVEIAGLNSGEKIAGIEHWTYGRTKRKEPACILPWSAGYIKEDI
jgi:hypothetical protein